MKTLPTEAELIKATSSRITPGKPFGWDHEQDMARIRAKLHGEGVEPRDIPWMASKLHDEEQAQHLSFKQRQDLAKWLGLPWAGVRSGPSTSLSLEEIAFLLDKLSGTNDPLGLSAAEKLEAMAKRKM